MKNTKNLASQVTAGGQACDGSKMLTQEEPLPLEVLAKRIMALDREAEDDVADEMQRIFNEPVQLEQRDSGNEYCGVWLGLLKSDRFVYWRLELPSCKATVHELGPYQEHCRWKDANFPIGGSGP